MVIRSHFLQGLLGLLIAIGLTGAVYASEIMDKPLVLSDISYADTLSYNLYTFNQPVTLNELTLMKDLTFNWAIFNKQSHFYRLTINGHGSFYFSAFKENVHFNKLHCVKSCHFVHSFFTTLEFTRTLFSGIASLHGSIIKEGIFNQCLFEKPANFSHMHIEKSLSFNNSSFLEGLNLSESTINGALTFNNTDILKSLDLSFLNTPSQIIDLTPIKTSSNNQTIAINLLGTDLQKIKMNYAYFTLFFPFGTQDSEKEKIYNGLLKNFKGSGDTLSYKRLLAEYLHYQNMRDKHFIKDIIGKYWWNYSTNPEWIFLWMLSFIMLYTLINAIFYDKLSTRYFNLPFLSHPKRPYAVKKYLVVRTIYSLPRALLFTLIMFFGTQFRMISGLQEFKSTNIFVNLYFIIIITTGMFCMFFLIRYLFAQISI